MTESNPMEQAGFCNKSLICGEDSDYLLNLDLDVDETKGNITKGKRIGLKIEELFLNTLIAYVELLGNRNSKISIARDGDGSSLTSLGSSLTVNKGTNIVEQLRYRVRLEAAQKNVQLQSPSIGAGKEKSDSLSVTSSTSSTSRAEGKREKVNANIDSDMHKRFLTSYHII